MPGPIVTAMSDRPHSFTITTPAGAECQHCGVTVEEEHVEALTIGCPAGGCTDVANRGEGCVFVLADADGRVECSYCERPGDPHGRYAGGDDLDWFAELTDEDSEDELDWLEEAGF